MQLNYYLLDVFTQEPLEGNPLAIVTRADGLSDTRMQAIAREFNLSETVFVRQPRIERHTANVRIFTPTAELPFAGHPTVGAAVLMGLQQRAAAIRLEEPLGLITCLMERVSRHAGTAQFSLPQLPEEQGPAPSKEDVAESLGLALDEIGAEGFDRIAHFSAGVDYYLVPVRDAEALKRIKLERRGWFRNFPAGINAVYAFTPTPGERGVDFAARMYSPNFGEDPATGSAAAALIGLLAEKMRDDGVDKKSYRLRQGKEIGRPSIIDMQVALEEGKLTHGGIGGSAVIIGEGQLNLPD